MNKKECAKMFIDSIKTIAEKPENLDNLEFYLSYNFDRWLDKYDNTPENIAIEMKNFAEMKI